MKLTKKAWPLYLFAVWAFAQEGLQFNSAWAEIQTSRQAKPLVKHPHKKSAPGPELIERAAPPPPTAGEGAAPFEHKLLRLAEILGALGYLESLCNGKQGQSWDSETLALVEAEAKSDLDKASIIGAFNYGSRSYALSYRSCTPNAQKIISRFISEGSSVSRDIIDRYGSS